MILPEYQEIMRQSLPLLTIAMAAGLARTYALISRSCELQHMMELTMEFDSAIHNWHARRAANQTRKRNGKQTR